MTTQIDDGQMRVSLYCFPTISECNVIGSIEINSRYQVAASVFRIRVGLCINSSDDLWKTMAKKQLGYVCMVELGWEDTNFTLQIEHYKKNVAL